MVIKKLWFLKCFYLEFDYWYEFHNHMTNLVKGKYKLIKLLHANLIKSPFVKVVFTCLDINKNV